MISKLFNSLTSKVVVVAVCGGGVGALFAHGITSDLNKVECTAKWQYADTPRWRFAEKHLLDGLGWGAAPLVVKSWDRMKWNTELRALLNYIAPPNRHLKHVEVEAGYGVTTRVTIILMRERDFTNPLQLMVKEELDKLRTRFQHWNHNQPRQGDNIIFYPRKVSVMHAVWNGHRQNYDIIEDVFVVCAIDEGSIKYAFHYDGHMLARIDEEDAFSLHTKQDQSEARFKRAESLGLFFRDALIRTSLPLPPPPAGAV